MRTAGYIQPELEYFFEHLQRNKANILMSIRKKMPKSISGNGRGGCYGVVFRVYIVKGVTLPASYDRTLHVVCEVDLDVIR